ncbi:MAG: preprotein translocase subunit SecE [Erysipelotrichaceae bacterium]|nr:preprotein translocase subunit SecE [Erysipelotrichaceae bacterium]
MMKWFNLSAIWKEISKIRWPKKEDLLVNSVQVIIFTGFFVIYFAICLVVISALLNALGVL